MNGRGTNGRPVIMQIDDYLISSEILTEYFHCDYSSCRGCCCIIGDSGAPLEENEENVLEREYPNYSGFMTPEGREAVRNQGFAVTDADGDLVTPLVAGKECAYTSFDGEGNCRCAVEMAWKCGKSGFRKPLSCALYPIRVSVLSNGMTALNLHRWHICADAFLKGKKERVPVYRFLREPIIRAFGEDFYSSLEEASSSLQASE